MGRYDAFASIHFPKSEEDLQRAIHRIKWEELFASQLMIARVRHQHQIQTGWTLRI